MTVSGTRVRAVGWVAVLAVAAGATAARGQGVGGDEGPGGGPGGGFAGTPGAPGGINLVLVLMTPAVQQELKLNDGQKTQVYELARDASRKARGVYQSAFQGGGPQALLAAVTQLRRENEQAAAKILEPGQKARAEQILLQVEGPLAVARPEVASKLNVNPAQARQVQLTMAQYLMAQRQIAVSGGGQAETGRLRDLAGRQIGRVLDAKQKHAFTRMLGEPFDVARIDPALARTPAPEASGTNGDAPPSKPAASRSRRKRGSGAGKSAPAAKGSDPAPEDTPRAP